jgi:hypothetical protein
MGKYGEQYWGKLGDAEMVWRNELVTGREDEHI